MNKKTRRQLKKLSKTIRGAWKHVEPVLERHGLAVSGLTGSGLLAAAARDPEIRDKAQALAIAVRDFIERSALSALSSRGDAEDDSSDEKQASGEEHDDDEASDDSDDSDDKDDEPAHTH